MGRVIFVMRLTRWLRALTTRPPGAPAGEDGVDDDDDGGGGGGNCHGNYVGNCSTSVIATVTASVTASSHASENTFPTNCRRNYSSVTTHR